MSGASNLGYGSFKPFSNVNSSYANVYSTNNPASFSSNEVVSGPGGLFGTKSNVLAAQGIAPGICLFKGGSRRRKIKNIGKHYKRMRMTKRRNTVRRRSSTKRRRGNRHLRRIRSRKQRGGYAQYQNNQPLSPGYSVGGNLSSSQLALANPPPITRNFGGNCVDNYNHFTNMGFPSKGH
jgi:hypothetical protein